MENRVAIITGAARGIGEAIAKVFAQSGSLVVVSDLEIDECRQVVKAIEDAGGKGLAIRCDVRSRQEIENMVRQAVDTFGKLDILVNNAGILGRRPLLKLSEEDWDLTLGVNLKGQFLCAQAAAREMVPNKWGRIINIGSISMGGCGMAYPHIAHYTASKAGVIGLTSALALELTPHGVNVTAICPGVIDTAMAAEAKAPEQIDRVLARVPAGRFGQPEEVARVAAFLASEEASYISGNAIIVDGGWLVT